MRGKKAKSLFALTWRHFFGIAILIFSPVASALSYQAVELYSFPIATAGKAVGDGQAVGFFSLSGKPHAFVWGGPDGQGTDLHPAGYDSSTAYATRLGQQVGYAQRAYGNPNGGGRRPMFWNGTAASAVDLGPPGDITSASAWGVDATHQVGEVLGHAVLWSGTAASMIDLHPAGYVGSSAYSVAGGEQVGYAYLTANLESHAMLWSGTAASAVDLNPLSFATSSAVSTDGVQQVGGAATSMLLDTEHAFVWSGTRASATDLHPPGYLKTGARDVFGGIQVGYGAAFNQNRTSHALAWSGTAASVVDLNQFLPAGYNGASAYSINPQGEIFGLGDKGDGLNHMIKWVPVVPEPVGIFIMWPCAVVVAMQRSARRGKPDHCQLIRQPHLIQTAPPARR